LRLSKSANRCGYDENGEQAKPDNSGCSGTHVFPQRKRILD
jgi:hypothetical protein